ncbi:O-antigen ligase family protein [Sulfurospirillum sp. 'SP']|nr:O-antigen ligase family protein [Sulfurospirillum sp. 'SP']WNY99543.1 O-antigen ligase family protein [Sulfurospirillum sp. 'SP']
MKLIREHLTEYLIYLLSLTFFAGKTYQIVTALVIVSFFVDVVRFKRWYVFKDTLFIIFSVWCTYLFISALWAVSPSYSMTGALQLFTWCSLYLAIRFTFVTKEQIETFIKLQACVVLFVAFNALLQFFVGYNLFGIPLEGSRVSDLFNERRTIGHLLPIWIGLFGAMLAFTGHTKRTYLLYTLALLGLLITLPLTGTRGPLVILAIFLPLIAWMSPYRKWAFMALGGLLIAVVCIIAVTPTLQQRLATLSNPFEDQRHTRIPIWLTALEEFKDNPILGVGFHNYRYRVFDYYEDSFESVEINRETGNYAYHAHSPWLDILSEQGLVGICFALAMLATIALSAYRSGANVLIGSMGVWYAFSLLNSTFTISSGRWSYFMILSISFFIIILNYKKAIEAKP